MWELAYKESWVLRNWCFWTVVLEKTLETPLDCKEIAPKGNQSSMFSGRSDVEAETPVLWHLMRRTDSLEKTLMLGEIEGRRGWQRMWWLNGITDSKDMRLSKLMGVGDGQGSLVSSSPWVAKSIGTRLSGWSDLDLTELYACKKENTWSDLFLSELLKIAE